jgi:hypothetical protein
MLGRLSLTSLPLNAGFLSSRCSNMCVYALLSHFADRYAQYATCQVVATTPVKKTGTKNKRAAVHDSGNPGRRKHNVRRVTAYSLSIHGLFTVCSLPIHFLSIAYTLDLFTVYSLPIHCPLTVYSLPVHCPFTVYSLSVHCLFTFYPLPTHWTYSLSTHCPFTAYSLSTHCPFTVHSLPIHCLCTAYSLHIHCLFTVYSLLIHCLFTAYSLPIHCLNTGFTF